MAASVPAVVDGAVSRPVVGGDGGAGRGRGWEPERRRAGRHDRRRRRGARRESGRRLAELGEHGAGGSGVLRCARRGSPPRSRGPRPTGTPTPARRASGSGGSGAPSRPPSGPRWPARGSRAEAASCPLARGRACRARRRESTCRTSPGRRPARQPASHAHPASGPPAAAAAPDPRRRRGQGGCPGARSRDRPGRRGEDGRQQLGHRLVRVHVAGPVRSVNIVAPTDQTSLCASTRSQRPRACSGDMNAGEPIGSPAIVSECPWSARLVEPRDAEVEDLDLPVDRDEDVLGLHVAVDDRRVVSDRQHVEQLVDREEHLVRREPAAVGAGALSQRRAVEQLHHEEHAPVVVDVVVENPDGVRVRDLVGDVALAPEAGRDVRRRATGVGAGSSRRRAFRCGAWPRTPRPCRPRRSARRGATCRGACGRPSPWPP